MRINRRKFVESMALTGAVSLMGFPVYAIAEDKAENDADVIVVDGGIAGCAAALEAAQRGRKVLLLQVQPILGGDSYLSTGWFHACNSRLQKKLALFEDSPEQFIKDSLAIAGGKRDLMWTTIMAHQSGPGIDWLVENGVPFENYAEQSMGSTVPRAIQVKGYGRMLINKLQEAMEKTGNVKIMTETRGTGLLISNGVLTGVKAQTEAGEKNFRAPSVVLATGDFCFNKELLAKYAPKFAEFGAVGDPNLKGDALKMLLDLKAKTRNLDLLNIVPTTDRKTRIFLTSGALSGGGILVNEKGERFCNELKNYTATALAMTSQKKVWEIVVTACHSKVQVLADKKMIARADSVADLARAIGVPEKVLAKELSDHNAATRGEQKDRFGRTTFKHELKAPFYYLEVMPLILQTLGGAVTNEKTQVLGQDDKPLLGGHLYAVGDVISGYLDGGYRTGDGLTYGLVTGRIAGQNV